MDATTFHLFPSLPPELRRLIWKLAMGVPRVVHADLRDGSSARGLGPFFRLGEKLYEQVPVFFFVHRESRMIALDFYDIRFTIKKKGQQGGTRDGTSELSWRRNFIMSAQEMFSVRPAEGTSYYNEPPIKISGGFNRVRTILIPRRHSLVKDEMERFKGVTNRGLGLADLRQKMSDVNARLTTFYMCWLVLDQLQRYARDHTGTSDGDSDQQRIVYLIQTADEPAPQEIADSLRRHSGQLQDFLTAIMGGRVLREPFWLALGRLFAESGPRVKLMLA